MMRKVWLNYWVDMVTGTAFLLCGLTGVIFLVFPSLVQTSGGEATILGVSLSTWHWVHDWSGVVMTAGVGVHLALHLRWMLKMTRKLGSGEGGPAPAAPRRGGVRARIVSPGPASRSLGDAAQAHAAVAATAAPSPATTHVESSAAASLDRLRQLDAVPPHQGRRYSRKAFLASAAVVGGAVLVAGIGLSDRDSATSAAQTDDGASSGSDSTQPDGTGDGGGSSSGSDGSSGSTTTTSEKVVVGSSCTGCGHCLQACSHGVFGWSEDGKVSADNPDACTLCGRCVQVCPSSAITLNG
jgi:NAD-dependent dihydropyrimidine dehydrogenase PreA subunit